MTTETKVSICLPTYQRPDLIVQCLDSCLAQTYPNIEVVIGDDSKDDRTKALIETRYANEPRISYRKHEPSLKQPRNIASLFARATGDKIVLIHDDDYLAHDCVDRLLRAWALSPDIDVAFGDQYEVDEAGKIDIEGSARLNVAYFRTAGAQGLQRLPGRTGVIQMLPNNGWMANADLVKRISYKERYGLGCEYVFGAELCLAARGVYYLKEYVSYYRKTGVSITTTTRATLGAATMLAYDFLVNLTLPPQLEPARRVALRRMVPIVVSIFSKNGAPLRALRVALTHLYAYRYGFDRRLYFHLARIAVALLKHSHGVPQRAD
jgi:glycosyltransferase involved in cell wall biosynthesis